MDFVRFPLLSFPQNPCAYVSDLSWTEYISNCTEVELASTSVSCCCRESFAFDMIPQVPQPCPSRNKCPPLGFHRRHSSLMKFLLRKRTHGQLQIEGTWDSISAAIVGGQSSLLRPSLPLLSLTSPFRHSRSRSRHDTLSPMYVFSYPAPGLCLQGPTDPITTFPETKLLYRLPD
jgi:hypothetical protein